jgi:hypothetical protein
VEGSLAAPLEDEPMPQKRLNFEAAPFVPQEKAVQFNSDPMVAEYSHDFGDIASDESAVEECKEPDVAMADDAEDDAETTEAAGARTEKVTTVLELTLDAVFNEGLDAAVQKTPRPKNSSPQVSRESSAARA